jgi:hypothetical protein
MKHFVLLLGMLFLFVGSSFSQNPAPDEDVGFKENSSIVAVGNTIILVDDNISAEEFDKLVYKTLYDELMATMDGTSSTSYINANVQNVYAGIKRTTTGYAVNTAYRNGGEPSAAISRSIDKYNNTISSINYRFLYTINNLYSNKESVYSLYSNNGVTVTQFRLKY